MNRARVAVCFLSPFVVVAMCFGAHFLAACASGPQPVIQNAAIAADVAAYSAEQQECITGSADISAARNCVAQVRARWCGPGGTLAQDGACGDGGVPADASMPLPPSIVHALGLDATDAVAAAQGVIKAVVGDAGGQ